MLSKIKIDNSWDIPPEWIKITAIDAHTAGEPLRIICSGFPELMGMYGCIILPPVTESADFAVLFVHNEGFSTMCGHGIIAVTKVVLETGMLPIVSPTTTINIDTPAGLVTAFAHIENHRVKTVSFQNVPSFVVALDETVEVPGAGLLKYDLAFGGAFYAFVKATDVNLTCSPEDFRLLIEKGMAIKKAIMQRRSIQHPFDQDLGFLYGTIFIGPPENKNSESRN
jgi:trans-L-3-hydroxyproline dehydratase